MNGKEKTRPTAGTVERAAENGTVYKTDRLSVKDSTTLTVLRQAAGGDAIG